MSKNLSAKYYQENKERLQWQLKASEKSFLRKKRKKRQHGLERYKDLSEDEKQKLFEYRKNIIEWENIPYYNYKKYFKYFLKQKRGEGGGGGGRFLKYKKIFEKYKKFFSIRARKFHFSKYKKGFLLRKYGNFFDIRVTIIRKLFETNSSFPVK